MKNEDLKLILDSQFTSVRAMLQARSDIQDQKLEDIHEQGKIRNGRLEKLENQTFAIRWAHCNPGKFAVICIVLFFGLAYGYHRLNLRETVKNTTGIEFKEDAGH